VFVKDGAYVILLPVTLEEQKAQITEPCTNNGHDIFQTRFRMLHIGLTQFELFVET
jgi:hypothetical protein